MKIVFEHLNKINFHYLVVLDGHKIVPSFPFYQSSLKITVNHNVRSKADNQDTVITFCLSRHRKPASEQRRI